MQMQKRNDQKKKSDANSEMNDAKLAKKIRIVILTEWYVNRFRVKIRVNIREIVKNSQKIRYRKMNSINRRIRERLVKNK